MSAKKLLFLTLLFMAGLLAVSASCAPQEKDVRTEAFSILEQLNRTGIQRIDTEIARLDQLLGDIEDRMVKLEQILPQTQQWLDVKKTGDYTDVPCG